MKWLRTGFHADVLPDGVFLELDLSTVAGPVMYIRLVGRGGVVIGHAEMSSEPPYSDITATDVNGEVEVIEDLIMALNWLVNGSR